MSYSIESIDTIAGIYKGVVIEECQFKNKKLFKIQIYLPNNYTFVYGSNSKLGNVKVGSCLLFKLSLMNYNESFAKDKYPVLLIKSILNSGLINEDNISNNIVEISNTKIKKINECVEQNKEYLLNLINDYDDYYKDNDINEKISNFLENVKLATYSKIRIENNEEEGSLDVIYRKEGSKRDVNIFSIVFDDTFTAFEYLDKILFFENNDKYLIFKLINKIFKHFNIRLDKNIDLEMKFIEIFGVNDYSQNIEKVIEDFDDMADSVNDELDQTKELLKDKRILIIGRGVLEHRQNLIYDICREYGFNPKNINIVNDNNKIISKGSDYIDKIQNNFYCGVIIGQTPHSSTGKYESNSLLDKIMDVANPKYCYVYTANISVGDKYQKERLKLSKARLIKGLEKIRDNLIEQIIKH